MYNTNSLKIILAAYGVVFALVCFIGRAFWQYTRTGVFPVAIKFGAANTPHEIVGRWFSILTILTGAILGGYFFLPEETFWKYFGGPLWMVSQTANSIGIVALVLGFLVTAVAQTQMGDSWRIGIDSKNKTALVYRGLYRYSRNPIYIGVFISCLGFALVLPCAATFSVMLTSIAAVSIQVRIEEEFLRARDGQAYFDYCSKVRRWI